MARGRSFRFGCMLCLVTATSLHAQDAPPPPPDPPAERAANVEKPRAPAPEKPASTREFRPSEEVSPDQEVDFPADL